MKRVVPALLAILLFASFAHALPEYQVKYNQTCALCHHNPTGGGMRTLYGAQFFSYSDLAMEAKDFAEIQEILPQADDALQYGFDLRGLYALGHGYDDDENMQTRGNEFVMMQSDIYFAYTLTDATSAVVDVSNNGIEEAFANFSMKNGKIRVRAGKFRTTYGWGWVDHTVFARKYLDYGSDRGAGWRAYDTGVEAGLYTDRWDVTAGLTNGVPGSNGNAVSARIARRFGHNALTATLGLSGRSDDLGGGGYSARHYGAFYGFNVGPLTFLGETNLREEVEDIQGMVATHQLRYMIKRGIYAHGWYEYYDPDMDTESGYIWRTRLGMDIIPRGYISISPMYQWAHSELNYPGSDESGQFLLQLHLWL